MIDSGDFLLRRRSEPGVTQFVTLGEMRHLTFSVLRLRQGEHWETVVEAGREGAVVLLEGAGVLRADRQTAPVERRDVWSDGAWTAYVPAGEKLALDAVVPTEAVLVSADAPEPGPARLLGPQDVRCRIVGAGTYERRVCDLLASDHQAGRLLFGETFNPPGHWSSFPPHRHERHAPPEEADMEEIYYFRTRPADGFAVQRMYASDGSFDTALTVCDGDVVKIPCGYHPVSAMPGCDVYYFWVLAGQGRHLMPYTDPRYRWLLNLG